jgi:DNA-binding MarR family transcriptional regulator
MARNETRKTREARALRARVQRFVRSFGLLAGDITPCGEPLPVSYAHALMILDARPAGRDAPTMRELAEELGIDKSNVTRLCGRMQEGGHLETRRCRRDGRVRRLVLTAEGRKLAKQVDRSSRRRFERLLSQLPTEHRGELLRGLDILTEAARLTLTEDTS